MSQYPKSIQDSLTKIIEDCKEALENIDKKDDDEFKRLEWIERDFTPHDGETAYYTMIKLKPPKWNGDFWKVDVSDGMARLGFSDQTLDIAFGRAIAEATKNFNQNKEHGWVHNKKEGE